MQYNLFMYCNGDPVNNIDPSGHDAMAILLCVPFMSGFGTMVLAAAPYIAIAVIVIAVISGIVYAGVTIEQQGNNDSTSPGAPSPDSLSHNEGVSKAPPNGNSNSEYVQKDNNGNVRSKTVYDEFGRRKYRDDFDHSHYDKVTHQYLQPHRHYWEYNGNGQIIKKGVQPIPHSGTR